SFSSLATFFHCSSFVDLSLSPIYLHSFPTRRSSDLSILGLKSPLPGQAGGQQRLLLVGIAAGIGELQPFGGAFAQFEAQAAGQMHLSCDWWSRFEFRPLKPERLRLVKRVR